MGKKARRFRFILLVTLGLALVLALSLFLYMRSGRLDLLLQREIVAALEDSGIKAEIGSVSLDLRGYKVTIEDLKLFSREGARSLGSVDRIEVSFSVISYLRQRAQIDEVLLVGPKIRIERDEKGRSNLDTLKAPERERPDEAGPINFYSARLEIREGEIEVIDRPANLTLRLLGLSALFEPRTIDSTRAEFDHAFKVGFRDGLGTFEGREFGNARLDMEGSVDGDSAQIDGFDASSDLGRLTARGRLPEFKPLKYDFQVETDLAMKELARVFVPETPMDGRTGFAGRLHGTGANYNVIGQITSDNLVMEGFTFTGLRASTSVEGEGAQYSATADMSTGGVRGRGLDIRALALKQGVIRGREGDFDLVGALSVGSATADRVVISGLNARIDADRERVNLSHLNATVFGGSVSGGASVAYLGGRSSVDLRFSSVDLNQAASLVAAGDVTVQGTADGEARLTFPGLNYDAVAGRIAVNFDASISPADLSSESTPATGRLVLVAGGGGFTIEEAYARSAQSEVRAAGRVDSQGRADIEVRFHSTDMAEVQRAVDGFGLIPQNIKDEYEPGVEGGGEFTGTLKGTFSSPEVAGRLRLDRVMLHGEEVGRFGGELAYSPEQFTIREGSVVREDGSRADFSLVARLDEENRTRVSAVLKDFDLGVAIRAAAPEFKDFVTRGVINGNVDLSGLPGPRTIQGTGDVSIHSAEFALPGDEGEDTRRVDVPEFTGRISIAESVLKVEGLRLQVADSQIAGGGTFNLDTYEYSIDARGNNFDLAEVSPAFGENVRLTGRADVTVVGDGKWDEWSDINLRATIQGQKVAINGRDLGDASLIAYTDNGLLRLEATGAVLDEPQTLLATVDLKDPKNYPVTMVVEFNEVELGPYLALVAPELGGLYGKGSGVIRLSGPLQEPEKIQAIATISKLEIGGTIVEGQRYTIANQNDLVISATSSEVIVERVTFAGEGTRVTLEGRLGSGEQARAGLSVVGELNLRFLSSFTQDVFTTGVARLEANVTGPLDSPRILGLVDLSDVGLRVVDFPLSIARGSGNIRFTSNQALLENFTASTPGGGTVAITGGAALEGFLPDRWRIEARVDKAGIEFPRDTQTVFDARLVLQGNRRVQELVGDVVVRRSAYTRDLTLEELVSGGGPFGSDFLGAGGAGATGAAGPPISLDVRITADETLMVRNNLADALGSAYLTIRGPIASPLVSGRVQLSRGTLEFRQGRHELTRGLITFPPRRGADPIVDFQAEADIRGYRVTTTFSGPLSRLQTSLRSDPELPEADIISLVLTGSVSSGPGTTTSATQTGLGLAQSILSASLSAQLERGTQRLFGLSRFSIDPLIVGRGNDPTARVTVGQAITKDLTVTYSQNLTSGPSGLDRIVLVEYRLSNRFSIVGSRNERGELAFDIRVRRRF